MQLKATDYENMITFAWAESRNRTIAELKSFQDAADAKKKAMTLASTMQILKG